MRLIMKRVFLYVALVATLALSMTACDSFLDVEQPEEKVSYLTQDVNFTATSIICKHFTELYMQYPHCENYYIEMVGDEVEGVREVMILDLLVPEDNPVLEAEFKVGYDGKFVALSKYDVFDPVTGFQYMGGCYYGKAVDGYIRDYYGFLTEGTVRISSLDGVYNIDVNAKSLDHEIKVLYSGPLTVIEGK